MVSQSDEHGLREALANQYLQLSSLGLLELASGNLSCRFGDGMLISPSGATASNISADTIVFSSLTGEVEGRLQPSSEWQMHAAIYESTDAMAVVHTHSDACVAVSCHGKPLPGFHYLIGAFGGTDVPCVPYVTFGSKQLAQDAAAALTNRSACLLGSHGMICHGQSLEAAAGLAQQLEVLCRQYLLTRQLGEPKFLTEAEWAEFFDQAERLGYIALMRKPD